MPFNWFCIPEMPKTNNGKKSLKILWLKWRESFLKEEVKLLEKPLGFSNISSTLLSAVSIDINQMVYNMKRAGKKNYYSVTGEAFLRYLVTILKT